MGEYIRVRFRFRRPLVVSPSKLHQARKLSAKSTPNPPTPTARNTRRYLQLYTPSKETKRQQTPGKRRTRHCKRWTTSGILNVCELIVSDCVCLLFCIVTVPLPFIALHLLSLFALALSLSLLDLCQPNDRSQPQKSAPGLC